MQSIKVTLLIFGTFCHALPTTAPPTSTTYTPPYPLCSSLPSKSRDPCYPETFVDCLSFVNINRFPFMKDFDLKKLLYDDTFGTFPAKVDFCRHWLKHQHPDMFGVYIPPVYEPMEPRKDSDCREREKLLRMEWMEQDETLTSSVLPYNRNDRRALCQMRLEQIKTARAKERQTVDNEERLEGLWVLGVFILLSVLLVVISCLVATCMGVREERRPASGNRSGWVRTEGRAELEEEERNTAIIRPENPHSRPTAPVQDRIPSPPPPYISEDVPSALPSYDQAVKDGMKKC